MSVRPVVGMGEAVKHFLREPHSSDMLRPPSTDSKENLCSAPQLGVQLLLGWEIAVSRGSLEERLEIHTVSSPKELNHVRACTSFRC